MYKLVHPVVIAVGVVASAAHAGSVLYVDDDGLPNGDGLSWNTAYRFLQDALAEAPAGWEIRVAQGSHRPDQDEAGSVTPGDRAATFQLVDGVVMMGGFAGIGAPDPDDRDIVLYETILSGDLAGDDGPDFTGNDENSYHVTTGSGTDSTAVLDGFTITAGNADGGAFDSPQRRGGGMYNVNGDPTVTGCRFLGNSATDGGGMRNETSDPTVFGCTFSGNSAFSGGGMYSTTNSSPTVQYCLFADNTASFAGAGMRSGTGETTLIGCAFSGNSADRGGGLYHGRGLITVTDCQFVGNVTATSGGAAHISNNGDPSAVLTNCTFALNSAGTVGGAIISGGDLMLADCLLMSNSAGQSGGGIFSQVGPLAMSNCTLNANTAGLQGGAAFLGSAATLDDCTIADNEAPFGAGIYSGSTLTLSGTTFSGNAGDLGGGIFIDEGELDLLDCMFTENTAILGGGVFADQAAPSLAGCLFEGNDAQLDGGGLYSDTGCVQASDTTFLDNHANDDGGAIYTILGFMTLADCAFGQNTADQKGGGVYGRQSVLSISACLFDGNVGAFPGGGGLYLEQCTETTLTDSTFRYNLGYTGCAVHNDASSLEIARCVFESNGATHSWLHGGGLYNNQSSPTVRDCLFAANMVLGDGAGIYNLDSDPLVVNCVFVKNGEYGGFGGGIANDDSSPTIVNCTFTQNQQALFNKHESFPAVVNCIMWDNGNTSIRIWGGEPDVRYSVVEGGFRGEGNLDMDPMFRDPGGPDGSIDTWQDNDYHLAALSPAIDAGDNTAVPPGTDMDYGGDLRFHDDPGAPDSGNPDGVNPLVDMGAYEFLGTSCPWDLDSNSDVGFTDLLALLAAWGPNPGHPADFDGDGLVGINDFLAVLANWGSCLTMLQMQLQTIRSAIELYNAQNPATAYDAATGTISFWDPLVQGNYLESEPENHLQNNSTVVSSAPAWGVGWVWAQAVPGEHWTLNLYAVDENCDWYDGDGDGNPD